ncbi:MAG: L-2-hydroxyglutarate oxidase [Verrucomicrobiota bacterium]
MNTDCCVIGGGLVGLATAYRYLERFPSDSLLLLEKDARVACQQSTHNSGVLHAGLYYKPGSEKAKLCVQGIREMVAFCQHHHIAHEQCGKLVVAVSPNEIPRLENLWVRGNQNGLQGMKRLSVEEMREREPHVSGIEGILVPEEGIVDYRAVADVMAREIVSRKGEIRLQAKVDRLIPEGSSWRVVTNQGDFVAKKVVNCGGLHSDLLLASSGSKRPARIIPFRGEYYDLKEEARHLVKHLIYPVPDPQFPFLGVHFTRMVQGGVEAGPNAVLAFRREGYRMTDFDAKELWDALAYPGLWKFLLKYPSMVTYELYRSFSRAVFCRSLQRLVPAIREEHLEAGSAGVRAQAMFPNGKLVEDFLFVHQGSLTHVVNAPSPAATSSLAIGRRIVEEMNK